MCEPSHSILQYSPDDKNNDDFDGTNSLSVQSTVRDSLLANLGQWAKRIRGWMHLSVMGSGHSEALKARSHHSMYRYHDVFTLFEAHWWNRQVKFDGGVYNNNPDQLTAATEYARQVSIGNLTQLRNFLEQSILKTEKLYGYVSQFRQGFLNDKGRQLFDARCNEVLKVTPSLLMGVRKPNISNKSIAKFVLGFTRKRNLIVPEWADDKRLWT